MTRLADPDAIFQALADCYTRLGDDGVGRFQARLILMLVAKIGDDEAIHDMIGRAAELPASPHEGKAAP